MVPIWKKEGRERTYKIYVGLIGARLQKEVEDKELLPEGQTGFRDGRGTRDNVCVMNHILERDLTSKGGKVYAMFVDLKAGTFPVSPPRSSHPVKGRL